MLSIGQLLLIVIPLILIAAVGCGLCWYFSGKKSYKKGYDTRKEEAEAVFGSAEAEGKRLVSEAVKDGESKKRECLLQAKEEIHKSRIELEREIKDRRNEIQRNERRLIQKEDSLDKKQEQLEQKEEQIAVRMADVARFEEAVKETYEKQTAELEKIAGMTREEAKSLLLANLENELQHETVLLIKDYETKLKDESREKAREIIATAIQKCAADYVSEATISVVALPNDDMKGRIIGREGRNIRTLETLTEST